MSRKLKAQRGAPDFRSTVAPSTDAAIAGRSHLLPICIALLGTLVFIGSLNNGFVEWDDDYNFILNPAYRGFGWPQLKWAWTTFHMGVYQPIGWMCFILEHRLWGLNPFGYHLSSLLLFGGALLSFYFLAVALVRRAAPEAFSARSLLIIAGAVSLFAVHPLRTEVVAWISCQPYLLCAIFYAGSLTAYLQADSQPGGRLRGLLISFFLFLAALLSKPVAISLPLVLLALDFYPLRRLGMGVGFRQTKVVLLEKLPFILLAALFAVVALFAKTQARALGGAAATAAGARLAQTAYSIWFYLAKTLWPSNLHHYYALPQDLALTNPKYTVAVLSAVGVTGLLFSLRRRWPALWVAWLAYVFILFPTAGAVAFGPQIAADRYALLATFCIPVLLAGAWVKHSRSVQRGRRLALGLGWLGALVVLAVASVQQCRIWKDGVALWSHALAKGAGQSAFAHNGLGVALKNQGKLEEAEAQYRQALALNPGFADAHNNLAVALEARGQADQALQHFREAAALDPERASTLRNLARALFKRGLLAEAAQHYRDSLRLDPNNAAAHFNLALLFISEGKLDEAKRYLLQATQLDRRDSSAPLYLGIIASEAGNVSEAKQYLGEALRLSPTDSPAHAYLGALLVDQGAILEGTAHLRAALQTDPRNALANFRMAKLMQQNGRLEDARRHYALALEGDPSPEARARITRELSNLPPSPSN